MADPPIAAAPATIIGMPATDPAQQSGPVRYRVSVKALTELESAHNRNGLFHSSLLSSKETSGISMRVMDRNVSRSQ